MSVAASRDALDAITRAWIQEGKLVHPQLKFFDDFIECQIHRLPSLLVSLGMVPTIQCGPLAVTITPLRVAVWRHPHFLDHLNRHVPLFPAEVRGTTQSYDVPLFVTFGIKMHDYGVVVRERTVSLQCADVPVMVRSKACSLSVLGKQDDTPGGYFVIRGSARVMLPQEQFACNVLMRTKTAKGWTVRVKSRGTSKSISDLMMQCRSHTDGTMTMVHPVLGKHSVLLMLRALGATFPTHVRIRDLERIENTPATQTAALDKLSTELKTKIFEGMTVSERREKLCLVLSRLVPHASDPLAYVEFMLHELLECVDGHRDPDDRQHAGHKRFETCDVMMMELMVASFKTFLAGAEEKMRAFVQARENDSRGTEAIQTIFNTTEKWLRNRSMTPKLQSALATGMWPRLGSFSKRKVDITEAMGEKNIIDTLEHLRKTSGPGSGKSLEAKSLHPTHWGFFCPFETPDGDKTGLVKYLAFCASFSCRSEFNLDWTTMPAGTARVLWNGDLLPHRVDGLVVSKFLRQLRSQRKIASDVGVSFLAKQNVLDVRTNEGRVLQTLVRSSCPLLGSRLIREFAWSEIETNDWVETLDACEVWNGDDVVVAEGPLDLTPTRTHVQMFGGSFASIVANTAPFANKNQVTRTSFFVSMAKQTASVQSQPLPRATGAYTLNYPQKTLVGTKIAEWVGLQEKPVGVVVQLAVMTDKNNYEDSLVLKKGFVDRGGMRMTTRHSYVSQIDSEEICDWDRVVAVGTFVRDGDVLVPRTRRVDGQDVSTVVSKLDWGVVDCVAVSRLGTATEITVTLRVTRAVEEGDKLCMAHGQKGTVGRVVADEDMPFSLQTGTSPDVLFNPHALPSRGTFGPLMELLAGKTAALDGTTKNATAWEVDSELDWRDFSETLMKRGYATNGEETFVSGDTGTHLFRASVGLVTMRRLKHLADEKQRAVARGARDPVTRQPVKGRANQGALRFGGMEVDALLAHGASAVLQDRLTFQADETTVRVCSCRKIVNTKRCGVCGSEGTSMPTKHAFLLATQEMLTLGVDVAFGF